MEWSNLFRPLCCIATLQMMHQDITCSRRWIIMVANTLGKRYHHKDPIPEAIYSYACLWEQDPSEKVYRWLLGAGPFWKGVQVATHRMPTKHCTLWFGSFAPNKCFKDKLELTLCVRWQYAHSTMGFYRFLHLLPAFTCNMVRTTPNLVTMIIMLHYCGE